MTSLSFRLSAISLALLFLLCGPGSAQESGQAPVVGAPWIERAKLFADDGSNSDFFGSSVALSRNTILVGAGGADGSGPPSGPPSGAAYVFERARNQWIQTQKLLAESSGIGFNFGFGAAVAIDGDLAVVGAPNYGRSGSAYVYRHAKEGWEQVARLQPHAPEGVVLFFGTSVAVSGNRIVVGASRSRFNDPNNVFCQAGSVHVFDPSGNSWVETALLLPDGPNCVDEFGSAVDMLEDTILVGARGAGPSVSGAAYIFEHTSSGWRETQVFLPSPENYIASFGATVALGPDTVIVGASNDSIPCRTGQCRTGSAYVFQRSVSGKWYQAQRLVPDDLMEGDLFGQSVALSDDSIAVGALSGDGIVPDSGSAYVYRRQGSTWTQEQKLTAPDGESLDFFGVVAIQGSTALVGAFGDGDLGPNAGAVYVFERLTASATSRGAGTNPASYTASRPRLGSSWTASVDLAGTTGHPYAALTARLGPANTTLPGGQVLLVGGPHLFTLPMSPGPIATWTVPIPADPALAGLPVFTQAAHLSGERPFALSNAVDLVLGY